MTLLQIKLLKDVNTAVLKQCCSYVVSFDSGSPLRFTSKWILQAAEQLNRREPISLGLQILAWLLTAAPTAHTSPVLSVSVRETNLLSSIMMWVPPKPTAGLYLDF